jgi:malate synthase
MEDLATFEISRAQTWQWLHHEVTLDDNTTVTKNVVRRIFNEELEKIVEETREFFADAPAEVIEEQVDRFRRAAADAQAIFTEEEMRPFLARASELYGAEK